MLADRLSPCSICSMRSGAEETVTRGLPSVREMPRSRPAVFATDAGKLESAPRRLRIVGHATDHDTAGLQLRGYATCARNVGSDYSA